MTVPTDRISNVNEQPVRGERDYVLYWMVANRRTAWNFSLDRAFELSEELGKPLVVFEALRCDYPWASRRFHKFVIDGMRDNQAAFEGTRVAYYPYLEPHRGQGKGLLRALADRACAVVTDDFPAFMLPHMIEAGAAKIDVRMERVDSNGLMPMRATAKTYSRAYLFRKYLQKNLRERLETRPYSLAPRDRTGAGVSFEIPAEILDEWPAATPDALRGESLEEFPIDEAVAPVEAFPGGQIEGRRRLESFLGDLAGYERANHPDEDATSGLSGYLHFGFVSAHEIFARIAETQEWSVTSLNEDDKGKREGWWGMTEAAESFLDQLITWRELGFNMCVTRRDSYDRFDSLPEWALRTLAEHEDDERPFLYSLEQFEFSQTHDELWNAAQNQLRTEGRIHTYLRMLWGKKILEWTENPRVALEVMLELNNKYALDGRDPNSYSGIFWVLGRYDRAWGPERSVYGKVRYMTSDSARRKLRLGRYLRRWNTGE